MKQMSWRRICRHAGWRGGGVATQRPAKPCTPVRFRSAPPAFQLRDASRALLSIAFLWSFAGVSAAAPTAQPPDFRPPAPSAHRRQIIGQDQQPQGNHPESKDGEKTENAAQDEQRSDAKPQPTRIAAHGMLNALIIVSRHGPALLGARLRFHQTARAANLFIYHESIRQAPRERPL